VSDSTTPKRFRAVKATADLDLVTTSEGGLPRALTPPGPSVVFRFVDGENVGAGVVAFIDAPRLEPGSTIQVGVTFPDAPHNEDFVGRRFELWLGDTIGSAHIVSIESDESP
jgi:hypothetical protein